MTYHQYMIQEGWSAQDLQDIGRAAKVADINSRDCVLAKKFLINYIERSTNINVKTEQ